MRSPRRPALLSAILLLLIGAAVAFQLPVGWGDGMAWALLVIALAALTAYRPSPEASRSRRRRPR